MSNHKTIKTDQVEREREGPEDHSIKTFNQRETVCSLCRRDIFYTDTYRRKNWELILMLPLWLQEESNSFRSEGFPIKHVNESQEMTQRFLCFISYIWILYSHRANSVCVCPQWWRVDLSEAKLCSQLDDINIQWDSLCESFLKTQDADLLV